MVKALIALSSYDGAFYDDGSKTGVYFVEAYHPWEYFHKQGVDVTFISETGTFGWDEHSIADSALQGEEKKVYDDSNSAFNKAVQGVKKPSDVKASDYDIFLAAGGHGAAFDFPKAEGLHKLAAELYANGKAVAAVCHGPLIFDNWKSASGETIIRGKKITGFSDDGEKQLGVVEAMKKYGLSTPREAAERNDALYVEPPAPWEAFVVVDGNLISGVNPASATKTAEKSLAVVS
ncbi:hypothetical protein FT663_02752 [Candidozyma haemuli var. vulneris]|uniref:D-lactate dehydratase n=1 Tax=Candidozyma haemuli TaxID=45357 RepID=A0A2V1AUY9_9ASCO|nr:hypothetical protein CXQ85_000320 [[Candida] haemuloni]KAF3989388.1 hypothetical protein FT662_02841 [[Candida] haemuloni var. vulneris]KAF3991345.1 hypothetical protein FT663_02752 [[Candida] haemuloni var. vulneris]PVH21346.1 hypothetical protein CXQ85_000320 [[Candida] haemuloni]